MGLLKSKGILKSVWFLLGPETEINALKSNTNLYLETKLALHRLLMMRCQLFNLTPCTRKCPEPSIPKPVRNDARDDCDNGC